MTVQPEKILKELSNLWVDLGHEEGVLRACAMTLIVACDGSEDEAEAGEALAELMREHPSRAIVLRVLAEDQPRLESRLSPAWPGHSKSGTPNRPSEPSV